ncbi:MAG TPA: four helix bundle protein, partial [Bacteroidia bacterium]|nr:four helix bundle protein [Bacteroidia bacterium]
SFEEADECCVWLDMIIETEILSRDKVELLLKEAKELASTLAAARKSYLYYSSRFNNEISSNN